MPSQSNSLWWLALLACCWPSPIAMLIAGLIVTAAHRGWFKFHLEVKAPRLNWRRNRE